MFWVYDLPNWLFAVLCIFAFAAFGVIGVLLTRGWVRGLHHAEQAHNDIVSYYLAGITVLYGITLGLLAVGAWTNYSDVEGKVNHEAESMAALYRDVGGLHDPLRSTLQTQLRTYAWQVVCRAWPAQRKGHMDASNGRNLETMQSLLLSTDVSRPDQALLVTQTFAQMNTLYEARRARLDSVREGMPASVWTLVIVGALISIASTWFFDVRKLTMHLWMTVLFSGLLGMMIYLTAALDNPFRGRLSVGPEAISSVYHDTMAMPELEEKTCPATPPTP